MRPRQFPETRLASLRTWRWLWVLLAALLGLIAWAVQGSARNLERQAQDQFEQKFERLEYSVRAQFHPVGNALQGLVGLYAAHHSLRSAAFDQWVAVQDLAQHYPGVRQLGWIEPQSPASSRDRPVALVVAKVAPSGPGLASAGWSVATTGTVHEALVQAIDFGDPVLTRTQDTAADRAWQSHFVYLQAVYHAGKEPQTPEERRAQLAGVVFASLSLDALFLEATNTTEGMLDFEVFDGVETSARNLVFSTLHPLGTQPGSFDATDFSQRHFQMERKLWMDGRVLLLRSASTTAFEAGIDHNRPRLIAAIGTLLSLLLTVGAAILVHARERALQLNRQMSHDIARLARVVQTTHHVVVTADAQLRITWANDAYAQVAGQTMSTLEGSPLLALLERDVRSTELVQQVGLALQAQEPVRVQVAWRNPQGAIRWYDLDLQPEQDEGSAFSGYTAIGADITEQHEAHAELQHALLENEQLLEAIDQHSIVSITDAAGRITYANAMFEHISGYSHEELMGANHRVVKSQEQPEGFWDEVWTTISSGYSWRGTVGNRAKNGSIYWVDTVITPFFDEHGHIVKYVSIRSDVTEARRAQAELRHNNLVMQSILENIPVALSVFDEQLHLIAHNRKFLELLDFPPALFAGTVTTFESLIRYNAARGEYGSENLERTVQAIIERAQDTQVHQFERMRPGGLALEVRGAPMPGGGFITTYADVSARKQAEAEIERTRNMLQSVLDSASEVAVITMDLQHHITLFNRGAERLLGYTSDTATAQLRPEAFFDPAELEARSSAMSVQLGRPVLGLEVLLDESVLGKRNEWTYVRQDGERISVVVVVTALTDAAGQRVGYLSVSHDITQEKAHEARLQIAMEEAEQASMAKGQFLANMSHEIRTPMNAILGMLKLLQHTALDGRQQDYAGKAESAAKALLGLLNDILDFSKTEAGKMQLDPQPFELDRLLRDLSVILSANVGQREIEVLFDLDPRLPTHLVADALRLQQILINLSGNAIKFTERGEVIVSLAQVQRSEDQVTLRVAVQDSGIGIDPKHQQHIFAGFSQAEASTTRRFGGTGLGLSISKRLVALMGGQLQLDSVLGQGSTFHFTITLPIAHSTPVTPTSSTPAPPCRVLLVDNHAMARKILASMAQQLGWIVETAGSGAEALQRMQYRAEQGHPPFQAVFVDWHMAPMDGWETARHMRQSSASLMGPVIAMVNAHGRETLELRSHQEPHVLQGFVTKPATASMLQHALQEAQDMARHPQGLPLVRAQGRAMPLQGMRLLVVEDNLINQQVARELLCAEGAQVDLAGNGQLGVDAVAHAHPPYDVVLMDLQMPVMDGYTAAVTIRHDLGLTELPIIAMTANAMPADREACLAAGMNDHIGKPFDVQHLVTLLRKHAGPRNAAASDTPPEPAPPPTPPQVVGSDATALLDVTSALTFLGGNQALYRQISEAYLAEIANLPLRLPVLLQQNELQEATRLLHTIKGLSLTVGAQRLSAQCKAGEAQLKACTATHSALDTDQALALCEALATLVAQTSQALHDACLQTGEPSVATDNAASATQTASLAPLHVQQLIQDLQQLEALLQHSDLGALDAHTALRQRHVPAAGSRLDALDQSVKALDFAQAVVQCQGLIRELSSLS